MAGTTIITGKSLRIVPQGGKAGTDHEARLNGKPAEVVGKPAVIHGANLRRWSVSEDVVAAFRAASDAGQRDAALTNVTATELTGTRVQVRRDQWEAYQRDLMARAGAPVTIETVFAYGDTASTDTLNAHRATLTPEQRSVALALARADLAAGFVILPGDEAEADALVGLFGAADAAADDDTAEPVVESKSK